MTESSRLARGEPDARTMLLFFACLLAVAAAAPAVEYDQRQDGKTNFQGDFRNIFIIIGIPKKLPFDDIVGLFLRNAKNGNDNIIAQDRADSQVMEAFVEPNTPYRVDIGSESERSVSAGSAQDGEVVIAGRRRLETEPQHQEDEMKLIGATEQCGPDRERDPVTLTCRFRADAIPDKTPEVVLATS